MDNLFNNELIMKKCLFCNKSFIDFSVNKVKKYCSYKCKSKGRRKTPITIKKNCLVCNKEFTDTSYAKNRKHCKKSCGEKSKHYKIKRNIYFKEYRKKEKYINYQKKLKENGTLKKYRKKYELSSKFIFSILKWRKTDNFLIPHKIRQAKRRADKLNATPKWANLEKIKEKYKNCPKGYHVDHYFPLQGKNVCGLHVENNLQYLPANKNISKGNKLIYDK